MKIIYFLILIVISFKRSTLTCWQISTQIACNFSTNFVLDSHFLESVSHFKTIKINSSNNELYFNISDKNKHLRNKSLIITNVLKFHLNHFGSLFNIFNETSIENSYMDFYFNGSSLSDKNTCYSLKDYFLKNFNFQNNNTFSFLKLTNVTYPHQSCPFFLYNSFLDTIEFKSVQKLPKYYALSKIEYIYYINSNLIIKKYVVHNFNGKIDVYNFNNLTHSLVEEIKFLNSSITYIHPLTFTTFMNLQLVVLDLNNFEQFVHQSDMKWLAKLNFFSLIGDLSDCNSIKKLRASNYYFLKIYLVLNDLKKEYNYPDEDFCKFKDFPHNNFVFPVINSKQNMQCTCTLLWLLINYKLENFFISVQQYNLSMRTPSVHNCFENIDYRIRECNFGKKLTDCGRKLEKPSYYFNCTMEKNSTCPVLMFEVALMFLVFMFGLPLNIFSFYALSRSNYKELMYDYLKIQIVFESISIFTLGFNILFKYSSDLYTQVEDISCDSDFRFGNNAIFVFKTQIINYISYVSISGGLMANFCMVLERYLFVASNKAYKKFNPTTIILLITMASTVLNIHHIDIIGKRSTNAEWYFSFRNKLSIIQDVFYVLVSLIILVLNVKLIIFVSKTMEKKKQLILNKSKTNGGTSKEKSLIFIVLNSSLFIICRLINLILNYKKIAYYLIDSESLVWITPGEGASQVFWIFIISTNFVFIVQFFINYFFNKNFRNSIVNLFNAIMNK